MVHALRCFLLAALAVVLGLPARAAVQVAATTADLAAITAAVGGSHVQVTALSLPTQDPHWVDARPNLALTLSKADLLVVVGLEMEVGWLPTLQTGSRNRKIQTGALGYLDCSQFVRLLQVPTQRVDRSMGDIHPGGNPHYTWDPRAVAAVARGIAARLGAIDPPHAADYTAGAARFTAAVDAARAGWEARLAPLRGQQVVGFHMSWPYLADWLGFTMLTHIEPRPGIPPTPSHVAEVLRMMRAAGAKVILMEEYHSNAATDQVASRTGAHILRLPGGTRFQQGQTYLQFMEGVVAQLESELRRAG